ncbi:MAG: TonB family protein [Candidatus Sulfotelmatobacter sp.]
MKSAPSDRLPWPEQEKPQSSGSESDLARLAAMFATHGAGRFSEQFSAELALEIVLNEIVEQACLTTGATGAAIILLRDGEMVCRASSGDTAPELGARFDSVSGLSGECIRSRTVERCDDAHSDPRVDIETCLRLGARSVMLLPLLRNAELVGLFEIFSIRPAAFSERDQHTLEALAHRVIKNLESVENPLKFSSVPPPLPSPVEHPLISLTSIGPGRDSDDDIFSDITPAPTPRADFVTWVLGLTVLTCALLLGARLVERSGRIPRTSEMTHSKTSAGVINPESEGREQGYAARDTGPPAPTSAATGDQATVQKTIASSAVQSGSDRAESRQSIPLAGSLRVYENGVEVFRMNPAKSNRESTDQESGMERSSEVERDPAIELPSGMAENSLLYRVEPEYPEAAREQHIEGPVKLDIHIDSDGVVEEVRLVSGQAVLGQAAIAAIRQWRFKPHAVHGQFVEMETTITLNFRLQR